MSAVHRRFVRMEQAPALTKKRPRRRWGSSGPGRRPAAVSADVELGAVDRQGMARSWPRLMSPGRGQLRPRRAVPTGHYKVSSIVVYSYER